MFKELQKDVSLVRILIVLAITTIAYHLLQIVWQVLGDFSDIILMLIFSWILSFVLEPIVDNIQKTIKVPKIIATLFTYTLLFVFLSLAILLFIPVVSAQIETLNEILSIYIAYTPPFIVRAIDGFITQIQNSIGLIPSVAQFFLNTFLVFLISFYLIIDKDRINREIFSLTPKKWHDELLFLQSVIASSFGSFLRVQLIFGLLSGISAWVVLRMFGIEFAAAIALLTGIFAFIPVIGPVAAIIPPVFFIFVIDPARALAAFIILLVLWQIIFNVIGSKLFGNAFKIHPIIVIVAILIGFKIAGGIGAVFAIPIVGIVAEILRQLGHHFIFSKNHN